ncbi:hypothetical protein GCM10010353_07900 [Streptomyces chryseus]|uniref:Uncharacterized protein n=1 Tax=Streptomyces chryseus TaxID=68186 RepID=A0ABQ3DHS9_9ACTN|nr:hypothetical protein GCM10010353_07900 [Streptomyces chryseus]GHA82057.1 hypothetical protein GCM10010346_00230 [Streptomyces chryseus]
MTPVVETGPSDHVVITGPLPTTFCRDPTEGVSTRCQGPILRPWSGTDSFGQYQTAMERVIR